MHFLLVSRISNFQRVLKLIGISLGKFLKDFTVDLEGNFRVFRHKPTEREREILLIGNPAYQYSWRTKRFNLAGTNWNPFRE